MYTHEMLSITRQWHELAEVNLKIQYRCFPVSDDREWHYDYPNFQADVDSLVLSTRPLTTFLTKYIGC